MNATDTSNATDASGLKSDNAIGGLFRTICAELRRGLQLAIEKYDHGIMPPF
ncbi:MAG TPA: hypothetical protein VFS02_16845 [Telluria sp.]|nr:hypothetical protein [Telluria sp.]